MTLIKFGQLNRWSGPADESQPADNLTVAKNLDHWQEGYARPRDGLTRPTTFTGIFHQGTVLVTRSVNGTFGAPIRSLMAGHVTSRGPNRLPFVEG